MSTNVSWPPIGGTTYSIPAAGELNWQALSTFLIAVGTNAQSVTNTKLAIRVATTTPVTVSSVTDCVIVTDLAIAGAVAVNLPAGITGQTFFVVDGKGDAASNNITITPNGAETINGAATYVINKNRAGVVFGFNGTSWTVLAEYVSIAAGTIPRSAIAAGTPDHVVINDGSGNLSSEAALAKVRGGTGADNSSVTFPSTGTIPTLAGTGQFTNKDYDGGAASNTLRLTLPKNATATLNGLTRKEATLVYDTDTEQVKYDDGSVLIALTAAANVGQGTPGLVEAAGQLLGTNTNDNAAAGYVGEYPDQSRARASAVGITTATAANVTATPLTLSAGDWDISGMVGIIPDTTTSITKVSIAISVTSATLPAGTVLANPSAGGEVMARFIYAAFVPNDDMTFMIPSYRVSLAASDDFYLVINATFTTSTMTAYGYIFARRVR